MIHSLLKDLPSIVLEAHYVCAILLLTVFSLSNFSLFAWNAASLQACMPVLHTEYQRLHHASQKLPTELTSCALQVSDVWSKTPFGSGGSLPQVATRPKGIA